MKLESKSWTVALLAVLALATFGGAAPAATAAEEEAAAGDPQVVVYYFHGERRCKTCRTIEAFAEETVRGRFAKQLNSGALSWQAVNFDLTENDHFIDEFGLVSSSLVLVEIRDGKPARFEVLKEAWSLVSDKAAFEQYIADAVRGYLG